MRLIDADAFIRYADEPSIFDTTDLKAMIGEQPTIEAVPVVHGRWAFTAHSFYRDEDFPDGVAYVMANCSECGGKHPNYAEVYHKTILRPDEYDCVYGWKFDEEAEQRLALEEAEKKRDRLSHYCPNCGAKMGGEA